MSVDKGKGVKARGLGGLGLGDDGDLMFKGICWILLVFEDEGDFVCGFCWDDFVVPLPDSLKV